MHFQHLKRKGLAAVGIASATLVAAALSTTAWSQNGGVFSGTDVGWNGSIAGGQTREVFRFIRSGSIEAPTRSRSTALPAAMKA